MEDVARCGYIFFFNFFQRVCGHPLKEVKASGGCYGIRKECFAGKVQCRFQRIMPGYNYFRHGFHMLLTELCSRDEKLPTYFLKGPFLKKLCH